MSKVTIKTRKRLKIKAASLNFSKKQNNSRPTSFSSHQLPLTDIINTFNYMYKVSKIYNLYYK